MCCIETFQVPLRDQAGSLPSPIELAMDMNKRKVYSWYKCLIHLMGKKIVAKHPAKKILLNYYLKINKEFKISCYRNVYRIKKELNSGGTCTNLRVKLKGGFH